MELKRAKESLWKLRKAEKKLEQTPEMKEIEKLEKRKDMIEKVLQKYKTTLMEQEKEIRKQPRNKTTNKNNKQKTKTTKLGEIWTIYRWITEFLTENNQKWEKGLEQYKQNEKKQLEHWDKLTRKEKIEKIQQNSENPDTAITSSEENTTEKKEPENLIKIWTEKKTTDAQTVKVNNNEEKQQVTNNISENKDNIQSPEKTEINNIEKSTKTTNNKQEDKPNNETEKKLNKQQTKITSFVTSSPKLNSPKLRIEKKQTPKKISTPKNSPKPKRSKGKEKPEEKTVKQLRGFWTTFAQNQKKRRENSERVKTECASAPEPVSMPVQAYTASENTDTCPDQAIGRGLTAESKSNTNINCCKDLTGNSDDD